MKARKFYLERASKKAAYAGLFLAMCLILPMAAPHIPVIGRAMSLMHIPVFLCGFLVGPYYGLAVGVLAPIMSSALTGMPIMFPVAVTMIFELGAYGFLTGFLFLKLKKKVYNIYAVLIIAMLIGRLIYGLMMFAFMGFDPSKYTIAAFWTGLFAGAFPAWITHILLVPLLVVGIERAQGEALSYYGRRIYK